MKVRVVFKCPNAIVDASDNLSEEEYARLQEVAPRWTMYGEIVTIEFDLVTGEAGVVQVSSIPGG